MKRILAFLMFLTVGASAQGVKDQYVCYGTARPCLVLGPAGSYYGQLSLDPSGVWALGYGTSRTTIGKQALAWDSSGNLYLAPFTAHASTYTASSGNLAIAGTLTAGTLNCTAATYTSINATAASTFIATGGAVTVSTAATSSGGLCLAGTFQTLPTSGYPKGCFAHQLSDDKVYFSTNPVTATTDWKGLW